VACNGSHIDHVSRATRLACEWREGDGEVARRAASSV
jgi:hypothetical protein